MSDLSPPIPFLDPESDSKDGGGGDDNNLSLPFSFFLSVRTTPAANGPTDCDRDRRRGFMGTVTGPLVAGGRKEGRREGRKERHSTYVCTFPMK